MIYASLPNSFFYVSHEFTLVECEYPQYSLQLNEERGFATLSCCGSVLVAVVDAKSSEIATKRSDNPQLWNLALESKVNLKVATPEENKNSLQLQR